MVPQYEVRASEVGMLFNPKYFKNQVKNGLVLITEQKSRPFTKFRVAFRERNPRQEI